MPDEAAERCIERLVKVLGIQQEEASQLVGHLADASMTQVLQQLAGEGPVPTSLTAHRAVLMRDVCMAAKQILTTREIAVLLRITESTANSVRREMIAAYETRLQDYLEVYALAEASWSWYKDDSDNAARKLTLATADQAKTLENELRRRGKWASSTRDGRAIAFPHDFDISAAGIDLPADNG